MAVRTPRVLLVADRDFTGRMIEWWGGGGWSHYANVLEDGSFIDARVDWVKPKGGKAIPPGVQRRPAGYLTNVKKWVVLAIGEEHHYERWKFVLASQVGKPYDVEGILNFITGSVYDRNWRDERAWFCDELGIWALEQCGICPRIPEPVYRITPGAALLLVHGLGGKVIASGGH